jgi:hypothetical protein
LKSVEERMAMLSGRTDQEAWVHLQQYQHHSNFSDLLEHFEWSVGAVRKADVEHAARLFLDNHENQT